MNTITLKKSDYEILRKKAEVYDTIIRVVEEDIFTPPPIKSRKAILNELKKTDYYSKEFLEEIGQAIKRSSFFTE
jgi:hypothetical protein